MQRGYRSLNRSAVDSVNVCAQADRVRALESCARCSTGESNAHSGPFAATRTEAHIFRRNPEDGSDTLLVRRIPGNGIPQKTGSKRGWQGESRNISWIGVF